MKLGIKASLRNNSRKEIEATHPQMCEVWFDINRADEYSGLFTFLKQQSLETGLHFWGALADGTWTTICYPDAQILKDSVRLIKKCIDIAAQNGFAYVNIHPGCYAKVGIDFVKQEFSLRSAPSDLTTAEKIFLEYANALQQYARARNIVLTVETVPQRVAKQWNSKKARLSPIHVYEMPISGIIKASNNGSFIANDFVHTAANVISDSAADIFDFLMQTTKRLAAQTRLVHLGFLVPPYNGTDNHDTLANPVLDTDRALPNKKQMIELLKLFANRDDVWILVEPNKDHAKNYFLAKEILKIAGVLSE